MVWACGVRVGDVGLRCDSEEVGGKSSYIGAYKGHMFVHGDFPVVLPKFGFSITYMQKFEVLVPPTGIWIFLPNDPDDLPSIKMDVLEDAAKLIENARTASPDAVFGTMVRNVFVSPLPLLGPGSIKVRAVRGDELVRLGALEVKKAPTA
jgi:hypothetical protein